MPSEPPIQHAEHPFGPIRRRQRCGRLKTASIKVNPARKDETAYLEPAYIVQPPRNDPKCSYRVIGLIRRQRRRSWIKVIPANIKIEHINDKRVQEDETTYLEHAQGAQPRGNAPNRRYGVNRPIRQHGCIKIESRNISSM